MRDAEPNPIARTRATRPASPDPMGGAIHFDLLDDDGRLGSAARAWLRGQAARAIAEAAPPAGDAAHDVRLTIVGDDRMAALHERHASVAGTTDVLTFDLRNGSAAGGGALDVDVVACFDEAARQAGARGIPVERELLLYLVHGVLHCLGHDDHTEDGFAAMHAREDEILSAIGVGATFGAGAPGEAGA